MEENKLDVRKAFEALARIMGDRINVDVTVTEIHKKDEVTEERSA